MSPFRSFATRVILAIAVGAISPAAHSHHLASDSDRELKDKIFHIYHIAAITNIVAAIAIAVFLLAWVWRDAIRAIRDLYRDRE